MNDCTICWLLKKRIDRNIFVCLANGAYFEGMPILCRSRITDKDIEAARKEIELEKEEPLTCSSCSFASGIIIPNNEVLYCSERDTRVPCTLEGCELHSERKKDAESNHDEVDSLDSTIDECFREMKLLIIAGGLLGKQDDTGKLPVHNDKESRKTDDQLAALKVCNEKISKDNEKLRDENNILQQEVALLNGKMKKSAKDFAAVEQENDKLCMELDMVNQDLAAHRALNIDLEGKLSRIKKELSGKWRLLEFDEKLEEGDQAFLKKTSIRVWTETDIKKHVNSKTIPLRRKITI